MDYKYLLYEESEGIATITANRPDKLNALNGEMIQELSDAVERTRKSETVRGVIFTGAGPKAFIAGADIGYLAEMNAVSGREYSSAGQRMLNTIEWLGKPVIAAINGYALGGGFELALACHLRVAARSARLGLPEVGLGIIPGYGGTQRLPRIVGKGRALELILTGDMIEAEQALRLGIVNRMVDDGQVLPEARSLMMRIIRNAPIALRYAIDAVNRGFEVDLENGQRLESDMFSILASTEDMREGMAAFLEKRKAAFKDR